jgi:hypothetical protein
MQKNLEQDKPIRRHAMGKPFSNDYVEVPSKQEHETLNHVFKQLAETFAAAASYVSAQHPKATSQQRERFKQPNYQEAAKHTLSALKHLTGGRDMSSWSGAYKETNPETGIAGGPLKYSPEKDYPTSYPRYIGENLKNIVEEEIKAVLGEGYPEQTQYYTPREVEQYLPKVYDEFGPYIEDGDLTIALKAGSGKHFYKIGDGQFKPTGEISNDTGGLPENVEDIRLALKDIPVPDIDPYLEPDFGYYESIIREELEAVLGEASPHEYDQTQQEYLEGLPEDQKQVYDDYRELLEFDPISREEDKAWNDEYQRLIDAGVLDTLQTLRDIRGKERKNRKPSKHGKNWGMPWGTGDRGTGYAIPGISEKANQFIKEELEATLDEGMFDFITGGSFDEEAFKEAASEKLNTYGRLNPPKRDQNAERVAEETGAFLRTFVSPREFVDALESGPEKGVSLVFKQPQFMRSTLRHVLAHVRSSDLKNILPRAAFKDWKEGSQYGLSDFNSTADAQYDEWISKHPDEAEAASKIVATIMADYYHNAFYGGESEYGTGGKEKEEFMNSLNKHWKKVFEMAHALAVQNKYGQNLLAQAFRIDPQNPEQAIADKFVDKDQLDQLTKLMRDTGYADADPRLYKLLNDFDHYDIVRRRNQY